MNSSAGRYLEDLYLSSRAIYASFGLGLVWCIIFIYLMSAFAETIAWICVVLIQLTLAGGSAVGFFAFTQITKDQDAKVQNQYPSMSAEMIEADTKAFKEQQAGALAFTIVFGILALGFLCCIVCGFKSLKQAIDVIDASADFLAKTKRILFVPLLFFVLTVIAVLIWIPAAMCVISLNKIEADPLIPQGKTITWKDEYLYMFLFMLFGILWICAWLEYSSTFVVMVSATTYYFNSHAEQDGEAEVGLGFHFAFMCHAGSIAVGAFIIALIRFINIIFMYLAKQAEKQSGDNPAVKFVVAVGQCILKCLEKICDYMNDAAFAYMAVSGESFCTSAWNGFLLNVKHMLKFTFANMIAKVFILLGKIAITVGNVFSLLWIMKNVTKDTEEVSSILAPVVVVGVVSFITASIFLGLFDTAVMALLTCLAIDIDMNGEPKFGPPTFHDSMGKIDSKDAKVEEEPEMM